MEEEKINILILILILTTMAAKQQEFYQQLATTVHNLGYLRLCFLRRLYDST
jgi:hypothetical protein